jgi:cytoskeletal protein CcmA (bactofilin family)
MNQTEGATAIGKSVTIRGELTGKEDLYMDGDIEGTITLSESRLTIGPNAHILADISARDIVILGKVNGNVHATGRVELRQTAAVVGDIFAGRLSIEESATVKGQVELQGPETQSLPHAAAATDTQKTLVLEPKA